MRLHVNVLIPFMVVQVQVQVQVLYHVKFTTYHAVAVIGGIAIQVFQALLDSAGSNKYNKIN